MPYTFEDFKRDYVLEHIHKLPLDDRLKGLSPDDRLKGMSADDLLKNLSADDLLKCLSMLSPEEKKAFAEKLLKPDMI